MPFQHGPFSRSQPVRAQSPRGNEKAPVFAVGQRAFVSGVTTERGSVVLTDASSTTAVGRLDDGAEVEITEWVPRGPATRYRVRSKAGDIVGWLAATSLRSAPASGPTPSAPAPTYVPIEAPKTSPGRSPAGLGSSARGKRKR